MYEALVDVFAVILVPGPIANPLVVPDTTENFASVGKSKLNTPLIKSSVTCGISIKLKRLLTAVVSVAFTSKNKIGNW